MSQDIRFVYISASAPELGGQLLRGAYLLVRARWPEAEVFTSAMFSSAEDWKARRRDVLDRADVIISVPSQDGIIYGGAYEDLVDRLGTRTLCGVYHGDTVHPLVGNPYEVNIGSYAFQLRRPHRPWAMWDDLFSPAPTAPEQEKADIAVGKPVSQPFELPIDAVRRADPGLWTCRLEAVLGAPLVTYGERGEEWVVAHKVGGAPRFRLYLNRWEVFSWGGEAQGNGAVPIDESRVEEACRQALLALCPCPSWLSTEIAPEGWAWAPSDGIGWGCYSQTNHEQYISVFLGESGAEVSANNGRAYATLPRESRVALLTVCNFVGLSEWVALLGGKA